MLNKYTAGVLAILLGGFGAHNFYLGQKTQGFLRIGAMMFVMFLAAESNQELFGFGIAFLFISAFVHGIVYLVMPRDSFDAKYNAHHSRVSAPANVAELKAEGVEYFKAGDYDLAIEAFKEALDVDATDPGTHFNLSCSYSKSRDLIAALHHLELSISYGLPEPKRIDHHPALEWLRAQQAFKIFQNQNYRQHLLIDSNLSTSNEATLELRDIKEKSSAQEDDLLNQIRQLGKLREMGILTEAEFKEQKEKLLA